jgi:hypothetical protein
MLNHGIGLPHGIFFSSRWTEIASIQKNQNKNIVISSKLNPYRQKIIPQIENSSIRDVITKYVDVSSANEAITW